MKLGFFFGLFLSLSFFFSMLVIRLLLNGPRQWCHLCSLNWTEKCLLYLYSAFVQQILKLIQILGTQLFQNFTQHFIPAAHTCFQKVQVKVTTQYQEPQALLLKHLIMPHFTSSKVEFFLKTHNIAICRHSHV